jgi:hypothetical protein
MCWVFGSPRTGSTWLLRLLAHPLKLNSDSPLGFRAPQGHDRPIDLLPVNECLLPNHLAPPLLLAHREDDAVLPPTLNERMASRGSYFFSPAYEEWWRPELRRLTLVRLHGIAERAGRDGLAVDANPAVIVKEVNGSHAADLVMSLFERARLLFLVRDGRDVVDSLLRAYEPGGWVAREHDELFRTPDERLRWVRSACRDWVGHMEATGRAYAAHAPELRRMMRYEDLRADPAGQLRALVDWLGVRRGDRWVERGVAANAFESVPAERKGAGEAFRTARPGAWRESLTGEEQRIAAELMGPKLAELGYE